MGFLLSCSCVHANKMCKEKAKWKQDNNPVCCLEQIMEATPHKTTAVQLLAFHLTNYSNKTNKTCRVLLEKRGQTHK